MNRTESGSMLDLKTLIAKSADDAEVNRVRNALKLQRTTTPEQYNLMFDKVQTRCGLMFNDETFIVLGEFRDKLM